MRSYRALTNIVFFILSFVTPYASHTTFIMNQNWSGSSFPTPLNTGSFIALAILLRGGGRGGMGEDGGERGEASGGVSDGGIHGILFLIKWITLCGETFTSSSSSSRGGETKGLFSGPFLHFCRFFFFA